MAGETTSPITQIEQAMLTWLRENLGLEDVLIESYAGQLDDDQAEWLRRLPCVWVSFDRMTASKRIGRKRYRRSAQFIVMAAQRVLGPEPAVRMGNGRDVGVYDLQHEIDRVLADEQIGMAIEPFEAEGVQMVMQGFLGNDAIKVMSGIFATTYTETIADAKPEPEGELVTIGLNYKLKPGDNVPDAGDVVTLRSAP